MERSRGLGRLLSWALVAAAIGFLVARIVRDRESLGEFEWTLRPGVLALSVLVHVAVLAAGVLYWALLLRRFGLSTPWLPLARAWFVSNLSRYIPGGALWQFVSMAQLGPGAGLAPRMAVTSTLTQMGFMVLAAPAVGVWLLPGILAGDAAALLGPLRWATPLALLAVHPRLVGYLIGQFGRLTRKPVAPWLGGWGDGVVLLLMAGVLWAGSGLGFFLFLRAFVTVPVAALPAVVAVNALAWLAGYVAFFAPAGLGFKEAALGILLAGLMPPPVAASLAVAARLWTVACETLPALLLLPRRPGPVAPVPEER